MVVSNEIQIFKVEDGALWYVFAKDRADAQAIWLNHSEYETMGAAKDDGVSPVVTRIQLPTASTIKVTLLDEADACPHCHGTGKIPKQVSLLWLYTQNAERGVVFCSEF